MGSEFASVMQPLATYFFGSPNPALSSEYEWRYGSRGSLSIDLRKGTFFDHEISKGGGVLELVARETHLVGTERLDWLTAKGFLFETVSSGSAPRPTIVATYDYCDADRALLFQVCRFEPKDFRQRRPDGAGGWEWSVKGVTQVPYRLPDLMDAGDRVVFVVEGEKDADRLWRLGVPATCNAGGANKWRPELSDYFHGSDVVVLPDRDAPGQDHAAMVAGALTGIARRVRVLELWRDWPDMPAKGDVSDWLGHGGTAERLYALAADLPAYMPDVEPASVPLIPLLLTAEQFIAGFTPPAYLIDGIMQRGYLYSLTARTHHGKTAVTMYIAQAIARSELMHGRAVKGGTVLLLAGENPDDIRARFLVLAETYGFDPAKLKMRFIAGVVNIPQRMAEIWAEAAKIDDLMLVIVDTAAAYFHGDDVNSNSQQGAYARLLRQLTVLPGKPAVLVNCHPIKNASPENLLPMGGSAFLNEVDGNLTLWANGEKQVSMHWLGKFRGPEFNPLAFELVVTTSDRVKDAEGRLMPSIVAQPISDSTLEAAEVVQEGDENKILNAIYKHPKASFAELAKRVGFMVGGQPHKIRVQRIIERLRDDKLITRHRGGKYRLTPKGEKEIGVDKKKGSDDE
jgi:AAA domain